MKFTKSPLTLVIVQVFCCMLFGACSAVKVPINNANYALDYTLNNTNPNSRSIQFQIEAVNVTGWVAIGINDKNATMDGADIFMGGYNATSNSRYGNDYHVPTGAGHSQPIIDAKQNWELVAATEANRTTKLTVRRLLNTTDVAQDVVIQNKTTYLLWSFNSANDSVAAKHTQRGSISINLLDTTTTTSTPKPSGSSITMPSAFFPAIIIFITAITIYLQ